MPKVSVIMGIYNCEDTLGEAIQSILNQTFVDWNMVMCDDGSSDKTCEIAEWYVKSYPGKFILLRNQMNQGLNFTLNKCLQTVDGEYVARMDGDDISLPTRFEEEVTFLDNHPEYAIVSTPMIFFDENGDWKTGTAIEVPQLSDFVFHPPFHCHAPCMIRREAYLAVGGYTVDKRLLRYEDCNLWYKLYASGYKGYNLQKPLYKMRDDRDAYARRTISSRMRAVYVQWTGFRMIHMPIKYYPFLLVELVKSIVVSIMSQRIYMKFHRK